MFVASASYISEMQGVKMDNHDIPDASGLSEMSPRKAHPKGILYLSTVLAAGTVGAALVKDLGSGLSPFVILFGVIIIMIMMMLALAIERGTLKKQALVLAWTVTLLFVAICVLFFVLLVSGKPKTLAGMLSLESISDIRQEENPDGIDDSETVTHEQIQSDWESLNTHFEVNKLNSDDLKSNVSSLVFLLKSSTKAVIEEELNFRATQIIIEIGQIHRARGDNSVASEMANSESWIAIHVSDARTALSIRTDDEKYKVHEMYPAYVALALDPNLASTVESHGNMLRNESFAGLSHDERLRIRRDISMSYPYYKSFHEQAQMMTSSIDRLCLQIEQQTNLVVLHAHLFDDASLDEEQISELVSSFSDDYSDFEQRVHEQSVDDQTHDDAQAVIEFFHQLVSQSD